MLRTVVLALALIIGLAGVAAAQTLDNLRANGSVGERYDGLVEARDPAFKDTVAQINEQRLEIYRERAAGQGVSVLQVGQIYAQQIAERAPAGTWFLDKSGRWRQ